MKTEQFIDDIVVGSTAKGWLTSQGLLPSSWGLESDELVRIFDSRIRISIMFSPASVLDLTENRGSAIAAAHLVILDACSLKSDLLSRREVIAVALHEIGHVVNRPKRVSISEQSLLTDMERHSKSTAELEADDYARHCGFGAEIQASIEKYRKAGDVRFMTDLADRRIKRIQDHEPLILHFLDVR